MTKRGNPWLNHGGTTRQNPVLSGMAFRLVLKKHNAAETLRKAWVVVGKSVFANLTSLATETDYEITIDVVAGSHLQAAATPVRNVVHFTTSGHRHARGLVFCATQPAAMIHLDGYSGHDPQLPLIYPVYSETLSLI